MKVAYTLSMPSNNSWNGRWSGEGRVYVVIRSYRNAPTHDGRSVVGGRFSYSFGDGWVAAVNVREVSSVEASRLKKSSAGFCGYDWMIDSIETYGKIYADHQKPDRIPATATTA